MFAISFVFIFTSILCYTYAANVTAKVRLNSGRDCPVVGLGTGGFRTGGPPQDELIKQIIRDAVEVGYRHFDTASGYNNEEEIGEVLNELISEGKVRREDIFLTTKIYSRRQDNVRGKAETYSAVRLALQKLNLTYVDLMLIHYPSNDSDINSEIWSGLEDALNEGLVKSIGVSNFRVKQLESLIKRAKVFPAMNQIESHPQLSQRELIEYCGQYKIQVTAYSPLGAGTLIKNSRIIEIGNKYNKTSAQVMIRWQIQRGLVVIPKSTKKERIGENFKVFDFTLTEEDMKTLSNM